VFEPIGGGFVGIPFVVHGASICTNVHRVK
jgi:hypothetical protein